MATLIRVLLNFTGGENIYSVHNSYILSQFIDINVISTNVGEKLTGKWNLVTLSYDKYKDDIELSLYRLKCKTCNTIGGCKCQCLICNNFGFYVNESVDQFP